MECIFISRANEVDCSDCNAHRCVTPPSRTVIPSPISPLCLPEKPEVLLEKQKESQKRIAKALEESWQVLHEARSWIASQPKIKPAAEIVVPLRNSKGRNTRAKAAEPDRQHPKSSRNVAKTQRSAKTDHSLRVHRMSSSQLRRKEAMISFLAKQKAQTKITPQQKAEDAQFPLPLHLLSSENAPSTSVLHQPGSRNIQQESAQMLGDIPQKDQEIFQDATNTQSSRLSKQNLQSVNIPRSLTTQRGPSIAISPAPSVQRTDNVQILRFARTATPQDNKHSASETSTHAIPENQNHLKTATLRNNKLSTSKTSIYVIPDNQDESKIASKLSANETSVPIIPENQNQSKTATLQNKERSISEISINATPENQSNALKSPELHLTYLGPGVQTEAQPTTLAKAIQTDESKIVSQSACIQTDTVDEVPSSNRRACDVSVQTLTIQSEAQVAHSDDPKPQPSKIQCSASVQTDVEQRGACIQTDFRSDHDGATQTSPMASLALFTQERTRETAPNCSEEIRSPVLAVSKSDAAPPAETSGDHMADSKENVWPLLSLTGKKYIHWKVPNALKKPNADRHLDNSFSIKSSSTSESSSLSSILGSDEASKTTASLAGSVSGSYSEGQVHVKSEGEVTLRSEGELARGVLSAAARRRVLRMANGAIPCLLHLSEGLSRSEGEVEEVLPRDPS